VNTPSEVVLFLGRFHPLLVHLPIGLIVLLAILEALAWWPRFKNANSNAGLILALTIPAAVLTAFLGWMLSLAGGYEKPLLDLHFWTGIATAVICGLAGLFFVAGSRRLYRVTLIFSVLALMVASHFGGSLTHGSNYLTQYAPQPLRGLLGGSAPATASPAATNDWKQSPAFQVAAKPTLDKYCVGCHGPEKSKAGLRMDNFENLHKGGDSGPVLVAGSASQSLLIKRMHLPNSEDEHMPPDGKPQPTKEDLALLEWWINSGADAVKPVAALKAPVNVSEILDQRFAGPQAVVVSAPAQPLEAVLQLAEKLSSELNIAIRPLSEKDPWLQCNASIAGASFGDEQLARLAPLQANLRSLDLGGTKITDAGLAQVAGMVNLDRLHLERTAVTDAGLSQLKHLTQLEYLNLYGTAVGDAGIEHLKPLTQLRKVFLWQTRVTPAAAAALIEMRTDKEQLRAWETEIEALKGKIRNQQMLVDLGIPMTNRAAAEGAGPVNTVCPVSGKPVDVAKTLVYERKTIAFCCDDCKGKFEKDPKAFLSKLSLSAAAGKREPINTVCPISGKPVNPEKTVEHEGKLIAFCCDDCKAKFQSDPKPSLAKLGLTGAKP
jgi:YHS domain-containing protein/uncharacterized membrane protein/mono/diheme cytochrome c family protein